jgi:hypothetical protein
MKSLHYILGILVFISMAIGIGEKYFIAVAMVLYIIQMILMYKQNKPATNKSNSKGGTTAYEELKPEDQKRKLNN